MANWFEKQQIKVDGEGGHERIWMFLSNRTLIRIYDGVIVGSQILAEIKDSATKISIPARRPTPVFSHLTGQDFHQAPAKTTSVYAICGSAQPPIWDAPFAQRDVENTFNQSRQERAEENKPWWEKLGVLKILPVAISGLLCFMALCYLMFGGGEEINEVPQDYYAPPAIQQGDAQPGLPPVN